MSYVRWEGPEDGQRGEGSGLRTTENVGDMETVLTVPLKLTMSALTLRLVKTARGLLKDHLDKVFARSPEWDLAVFLLYEERRVREDRPTIRAMA